MSTSKLPSRRAGLVLRGWTAALLLFGLGLGLGGSCQAGTTYPEIVSYQGLVKEAGARPTGTKTFRFVLWDDPAAGNLLWDSTDLSISVSNGLYSVLLGGGGGGVNDPIPASVFEGNNGVYLEITYESQPLSPRERLVASAYALNAKTVADGSISEAKLATNVAWKTNGNAGTTPATHFVGTTDAQPLVLRAFSNEVMRLLGNGRVGIGTPSPTQQLDVVGTVKATAFQGDGSALTGKVSTSGDTMVGTLNLPLNGLRVGGGSDQLVCSNGNVGIGTLGTSDRLTVAGNVNATGGITANGLIRSITGFLFPDSSTQTTAGWQRTGNSGTKPSIHFVGTTDNQPLALRTNDVEVVRLVVGGNVGIGTPGPTERLHVSGNIKGTGTLDVSGYIYTGSTITAANKIRAMSVGFEFPDGTTQTTVGWQRTGNAGTTPGTHFVGTTDSQALVLKTNSAEVMRLLVGGNVGIGTPAPSAKLEVSGAAKATSLSLSADGLTVGGSQLVASGGNVGIGVPLPGQKLSVGGIIESTTGGFKFPDATIQTTAATPSASWSLTGNAGTTPGVNFVGTTDNQALEMKVNSQRAFRIEPHGTCPNIIGGQAGNVVTGGVYGATISGGGFAGTFVNRVTDDYGTIGGGSHNQAGDGAGTTNDMTYATVGGGNHNNATGWYSTVGGGRDCSAAASYATVAGGSGNGATANYTTVAGGTGNLADTAFAAVGGGYSNQARSGSATIAGGYSNNAYGNTSMIPGGAYCRTDGAYSLAAGYYARAQHDGCFVWADSSLAANTTSSANHQFIARASGGVKFYSKSDLSVGVQLAANGNSWSSISDRNRKKNFRAINGEQVLGKIAVMPVTYWNYDCEKDTDVPHIGPVAQDLVGAFYPGADDKSISTQQADGVHFAAIKALEARTAALRQENAELRAANAALAERLARLEQTLCQSLVKTPGTGGEGR